MAYQSILTTIFVILGVYGHSATATEIKIDPQALARQLTKMALQRSTCKQLREDLREAQRRKNLYLANGLLGKDSMALIGTSQPWNEALADSRPQLPLGRYKVIADGLIDWLSGYAQDSRSVTPTLLVKRAMALSGDDLLAALGAIGSIFEDPNLALYGNRMLPLFTGHTSYSDSDNTGFWKSLNANLIHVDMNKKYTSWLPTRYSEQQLAEHLGYEVGSKIHALIKDRLECGKLKENL